MIKLTQFSAIMVLPTKLDLYAAFKATVRADLVVYIIPNKLMIIDRF